MPRFALILAAACSSLAAGQQLAFTDATRAWGLGDISASRLCLADLNGDGRPDAVVREIKPGQPDRYRVFLNLITDGAPRFVERNEANLPAPQAGDCLVFTDIDGNGRADAVLTRDLDINNKEFKPPAAPEGTCWIPGKGDGAFEEPKIIESARRATTACIAAFGYGGQIGLCLGNWYTRYGESLDAFGNDLLIPDPEHPGGFHRLRFTYELLQDVPEPDRRRQLAEWTSKGYWLDQSTDQFARPTYGIVIAYMESPSETPMSEPGLGNNGWLPWLLELNYGRRANRMMMPMRGCNMLAADWAPFVDVAETPGFAGDEDTSGKYPDWLQERAKSDARFARDDEKPFRSHGNTFDAAVGDIDNDGDFDLFLTEITHGWAGPSSDRSRFLVNADGRFRTDPRLSVDRIPADPTIRNWNQGDLFAELADFDHDGRLDLLLSSGDYPDNQRLRLFRQQDDGTFKDITPYCGLNNDGSQQISLGDVDLDGDIDILVGQSFNRLDAAQVAGRTPTLKLYLNQTVERRRERAKNALPVSGVIANSIELRLVGNPSKQINLNALGAIVRIDADLDNNPATPPVVQSRQLIGIGGHAGKQHEFLVHVGLGSASAANRVEIIWPSPAATRTILQNLPAGLHTVTPAGLQPSQ